MMQMMELFFTCIMYLTMEGCEPRDMEEVEKDALRFAKKLGHSVENLKILRAPNTINPFTKYRIDISKLDFIESA